MTSGMLKGARSGTFCPAPGFGSTFAGNFAIGSGYLFIFVG
jgi:hypothetical protein